MTQPRCRECAFFARPNFSAIGTCRHADIIYEEDAEFRANVLVGAGQWCEHHITQQQAAQKAAAAIDGIAAMWADSLDTLHIAWVLELPESAVWSILPRARDLAKQRPAA